MKHDYAPSYYYVREKRSKNKSFTFLAGIILIFGIIFFLTSNSKKDTEKVAGLKTQAPLVMPKIEDEQPNVLSQTVDNALKNASGDFGIAIINLKTQEYYLKNEYKSFQSASLYKLWVMGTIMDQIKNNKIKETDILKADIDKLYEKFNLASPSAMSDISISVKDAVEKMITVSDNTTALLLSSKAQLSNVKTFLGRYGLTGSKLGTKNTEPLTNAYDTALFFRKLYNGEIIDREYSDKMLDILKRQRLNSKLPKYLPENVVIAHKTGELDGYSHDAGIVYTPTSDFIIVVLTNSNVKERDQAEEVLSNISKDVYDYFIAETSNNSDIDQPI